MAEKYIIQVTAGSEYDLDRQVVVPVNSSEPIKITNEFMDIDLNVRIQNYHGLPRNSPASSAYFSHEHTVHKGDRYSIAIRFTPKKPTSPATANSQQDGPRDAPDAVPPQSGAGHADNSKNPTGISGQDLQFGNDFDHPIRDRLPPGFNYAMNIVKWWIDPGLDGDAYADRPHLYGPALSSFNVIHVGAGEVSAEKGGLFFAEGGDEAGMAWRRNRNETTGSRCTACPDEAKARMKWALAKESKEAWSFEYGRTYCVDFANPYLDFNDFALRLPGFTMPIMKYWDGQPLRDNDEGRKPKKRSHALRYVLRNRSTGDTYLAIVFTLYLKEDVNEDGSLNPAALAPIREQRGSEKDGDHVVATGEPAGDTGVDYEAARKHFEKMGISKEGEGGDAAAAAGRPETNEDDVD